MKTLLSFLISLNCYVCFSQKAIPVIKAHSSKANFYVSNNSVSGWRINPKLKSDVFSTGKLTKSTTVKFKTDIDSISFKIKPGQNKDFIILLNDKDSCLTRIQSTETKNFSRLLPEIHDSIPFFLNKYNTNFLRVVFNGTDSLILNFDTGANEVALTNDALKNKFRSVPKLYNKVYDLKIGSKLYKSKVHDIEMAGHETDGLLGWDNFDGMIVELNYNDNKMIVHSKMPNRILHDKGYDKLKIQYISDKPFIECELLQSGSKSKNWFLFDLGYVRTVMLDNDLLKQANFPVSDMKVIKKVIMHGVSGNEIPVITSDLQILKIGIFELKNVPAQILAQNKPTRGTNEHILGNDVLKRFNTVLDFQKNVIYLKPNNLFNEKYTD